MDRNKVKQFLTEHFEDGQVKYDEPMKNHTSFRTGGAAACFVQIGTKSQLAEILAFLSGEEIPFFVMGNGSNLLVGDRGYDGVIVHLGAGFDKISVEGNTIRAYSGALLSRVANAAYENGLTGLEFASGIPGSVGGAVFMNAGAYDGEMKMVVTEVTMLDYAGNEITLSGEEMAFDYRTSILKKKPYVVVFAVMALQAGDRKEIKAKMDDFASRRREKQPLEFPSAGSTFKRPEGYFAGKLIQDAGLRGFRVGGAMVSEKHCGFVINKDHATSQDVAAVMQSVHDRVKEQFGVELEPEVIKLGEF